MLTMIENLEGGEKFSCSYYLERHVLQWNVVTHNTEKPLLSKGF
ncbi:hypothetical protein J2Y67_000232 [Neobacillus niacini]|nr:hypothetical protein [Neobacillus niacini]